jgi:hypothetical protein
MKRNFRSLAFAAGIRPSDAARYLKKHPRLFRAALVAWAVLAASACATMQATPPTAPCQAWVAAQASWSALNAYVSAQLEQQRAAACYLPPPPPGMPAEPTPTPPTAPPPQVPLPGVAPREE